MAETVREIQLRSAERAWATLRIEADGKKVLCHQLSEAELAECPALLPYEGPEQLHCHLLAGEHGPCIELGGANGKPKVPLVEGDDGELYEVADPRGDAQLCLDSASSKFSSASKRTFRAWEFRGAPKPASWCGEN